MGAIALAAMIRTSDKSFLKWVLRVTEKYGNYPLETSGDSYYNTADRNNLWVVFHRWDDPNPCTLDKVHPQIRVVSPHSSRGGIPFEKVTRYLSLRSRRSPELS